MLPVALALTLCVSKAAYSPSLPTTPACSLNGELVAGKCHCDKPWKGSACEFIDLLPVTYPQGYGMPHAGLKNITTWGGNILYDNATGTHHLYVSRMTNDCNLVDYMTNSRIDHAVSSTGPTGPYTFRDVAIPTFSHNAAPIVLPDGTYAIFHVGAGVGPPDGGRNCSNRTAGQPPSVQATPFQDLDRTGRTTYGVHVSKSLDGPWTAVPGVKACNNPAPWVHPNGTIYLWCGSLLRADSITGPYTKVGNQTLSGTGVAGHLEDPQIWTDKRGNWHCLFHVFQYGKNDGTCVGTHVSAHHFSEDGLNWHTLDGEPYSNAVELTTGKTVVLATRERPKLFFNVHGEITHLLNGVCGVPFCSRCEGPCGPGCCDCKYFNWDFTLIQPVAVA